jgi:hypothetical protein
MLSVALYRYPTLAEEDILKVFENKELRRIFGAWREETTRPWRKSF